MKIKHILFFVITVLCIFSLLLTGCSPSALTNTEDNSTEYWTEHMTEFDTEYGNMDLAVFNQHDEIIHKNDANNPPSSLKNLFATEPNPGGFGMTLSGGNGTFARGGDFFFLSVDLINNTNTSYIWKGSSTEFNAQADLVCIQDGREIAKVQGVYKITDDICNCEVKPGESSSRMFRFYLPEDAPSGNYTLVCKFRSTTIKFEGYLNLE